MTAQSTMRDAIALGRDWGPLWSCVVLFIFYQIAQAWHFRKKRTRYNEFDKLRDEKIEELQEKIHEVRLDHAEQFADFRVQLEKRTTFTWMEEKVLPKIDKLAETVSSFKATVDLLIEKGFGK